MTDPATDHPTATDPETAEWPPDPAPPIADPVTVPREIIDTAFMMVRFLWSRAAAAHVEERARWGEVEAEKDQLLNALRLACHAVSPKP